MSELNTTLDEILQDKNTNLLPENLKAGITCLGVEGSLQMNSNVVCMLYASIIDYFVNNHGMRLNDSNQSAFFTSIVNKRLGETFNIEQEYDFLPQNVYGIKIKSYDLNTGKVEYELPSTINMNNNMHNIYLPSTWQVGDKLDFYVNLYVDSFDMNNIPLPLSFIFKDIELVYIPTIEDAEYIQLSGKHIMTVTSNYSVGDNITIQPLNMNSSWEIGQTMRIKGLQSNGYIDKDGTIIQIPSVYDYNVNVPFIVGTINNIDTENKKVTLTITELNMLYEQQLDVLDVDNDVYNNKDLWLPSFSTDVANNSTSRILLQNCSVDEIPNRQTQSNYYDTDNPDKSITRVSTYTDNVTGIRNGTNKFNTFVPDNNSNS